MKIRGIDHMVLTVRSVPDTLAFYTQILGMEHRQEGSRHELYFGEQKINLHSHPGQFQPAAQKPCQGSADFCLEALDPIDHVLAHVRQFVPIEVGPVARQGARGAMHSIYVRDPDGNLVEICVYDK